MTHFYIITNAIDASVEYVTMSDEEVAEVLKEYEDLESYLCDYPDSSYMEIENNDSNRKRLKALLFAMEGDAR